MSENTVVDYDDVVRVIGNTSVLLIDVREPKELQETGVIPSSINIPLATLADTLTNLSPEAFFAKYEREKPNLNTPIVVSCRSGRRSTQAYEILIGLGYTNVKNYKGSWLDWEQHLDAPKL